MELKLISCHYIPENIEDGSLYISLPYGTAIHNCPCGCGLKTVTPFTTNNFDTKDKWSLNFENIGDDKYVTINPSILNRSCGTHYYIIKNKINYC